MPSGYGVVKDKNGNLHTLEGKLRVPLQGWVTVRFTVTSPQSASELKFVVSGGGQPYALDCTETGSTEEECRLLLSPPPSGGETYVAAPIHVEVVSNGEEVARSGDYNVLYSSIPNTGNSTTWGQIREFQNSKESDKKWAWRLLVATGALTCVVVGGPLVGAGAGLTKLGVTVAVAKGLAWVAGTGSAAFGASAVSDGWKADDPIDPNYAHVATPVYPAPLLLPATPGPTGAMVAAYNALAANVSQDAGLTTAMVTALNRAEGASKAGDTTWARRQLVAASSYANADAQVVRAKTRVLASLRQAIAEAGARFSVSAAQARQFEQDVVAHGLPASVLQLLSSSGMGASRLSQLEASLRASPAAAGQLVFPDLLTDPQLVQAIAGEAAALEQFARGARHVRTSAVGADLSVLLPTTTVPAPLWARSSALALLTSASYRTATASVLPELNPSCPSSAQTTSTTLVAKAYAVFLLTNVSGGSIWVGQQSQLKGKRTCDFVLGGLCADNGGADIPVAYQKETPDYPTFAQAMKAYCRALGKTWYDYLADAKKGHVFGGDYYLANVGDCPA
jgi:hypothetical protein